MTRHRVALVGLGMVAATHARALQDLRDRVEVVHAFSPSPARREAFGRRFPFPLCAELETILADSGVDAVVVLSPANTHLDIARRCAEAGKHVLLEKPVEITTARAEQLVAACEAAGVTLGIVLQHRFRPAAERLRAIVGGGALGDVCACFTSIDLWRPQSYYDEPGRGTFARDGGGVLISQGIHTLDLMLTLAGPVAEVRGFCATTPVHHMETEDLVAAALRYDNGALGTLHATTAAFPGFSERIRLVCEKGTATLEGTGLVVAWHDGHREEIAPIATAGGTGADPMAFPHDWHRSVIADFLDALDEGRPPRVTGREALKVHRLIDALIAASASDGPVHVARDHTGAGDQ